MIFDKDCPAAESGIARPPNLVFNAIALFV
jgi:hypothetical protein